MRVGVMLRRLRRMVRRMHGMALRDMRVVAGLLVVAFLVKFCRLAVMFGRVFVMLGCCLVMFGLGVAGHDDLPLKRRSRGKTLARLRAGGVTLA
jgi:hypothetical protein